MQEMQKKRVQSLHQEDALDRKWQPTSVFLLGKFHKIEEPSSLLASLGQTGLTMHTHWHNKIQLIVSLFLLCLIVVFFMLLNYLSYICKYFYYPYWHLHTYLPMPIVHCHIKESFSWLLYVQSSILQLIHHSTSVIIQSWKHKDYYIAYLYQIQIPLSDFIKPSSNTIH